MHCCYGWELCVSIFMAPSDSQHPEIGVRVERRRKRWRKQKKTNIESTLNRLTVAGIGQTSHGGKEGAKKGNRGGGTKRENKRVKKKIFTAVKWSKKGITVCQKSRRLLFTFFARRHKSEFFFKCLSRVLTHWWPDSISHSFDLWPQWLPQLVKRQEDEGSSST